MSSKQQLDFLVLKAIELGATYSTIINSSEIVSTKELAAMCNAGYICPNYGLSAGCPPNVSGPDEFKKWQLKSDYSVTVKIEVLSSIMFSSDRNEIMRLLHQIVSAVEQQGVEAGFSQSKSFAGGSCKKLFCETHKSCSALEDMKSCRHPEVARPSMSGFGIDVTQLMKTSGWSAAVADKESSQDEDDVSWVAGLILLA